MRSASSCLLHVFSFAEYPIKRSTNTIKIYGELFWNIYDFWEMESMQTGAHSDHNPPGRAWGPRCAQVCYAHLVRRLELYFWHKKDNLWKKNSVKISAHSELWISRNLRNREGPNLGSVKQKRTEREIQPRRGSCRSAAMEAMD